METNNAKVLRARLMDQPEDFMKLGINPAKVEKWEDGRRTMTEEVGSEIWYFDGTMEDGTKHMVGFRPKSPEGMTKFEDSPHVNIYIKSPDGKEFRDDICYGAAEGGFSREQCDSKCGPHWCKGDFKQYDIHFEPVHGVGLDLHYDALTDPFRQGTSLLAFGDNDEFTARPSRTSNIRPSWVRKGSLRWLRYSLDRLVSGTNGVPSCMRRTGISGSWAFDFFIAVSLCKNKSISHMMGHVNAYFARNSEGVRPVTFLKIRLKWCVYPKPSKWAVSLTLCPCIRRLFPLSTTKEWM